MAAGERRIGEARGRRGGEGRRERRGREVGEERRGGNQQADEVRGLDGSGGAERSRRCRPGHAWGGNEKARGRGRAEGRGRHEPPAAPRKTTKEKGRPLLDDISEMSERLVRELGVARTNAKTLLRVRALRERRQRKGCGPELADAEPASPSSSTSDSKAATAPSVASPAACTAASPAAFAAVAPTASPAATQITPPAAPSTSPTAAADGPVPDELQADWSFDKRCAPLSLTRVCCAFGVFGVC